VIWELRDVKLPMLKWELAVIASIFEYMTTTVLGRQRACRGRVGPTVTPGQSVSSFTCCNSYSHTPLSHNQQQGLP
jgi:hypothetical protein